MKWNKKAVVLGLAALVIVAVAAVSVAPVLAGHGLRVLASFAVLVGVTVTYAYPVSGATPPTAPQSARKNMVTATVVMADAETQATVTHNWGDTTDERADKFPVCTWAYVTPGTGPALISFSRSTNAVVVTKNNAAGSGGTFEVSLSRPHSIIR